LFTVKKTHYKIIIIIIITEIVHNVQDKNT